MVNYQACLVHKMANRVRNDINTIMTTRELKILTQFCKIIIFKKMGQIITDYINITDSEQFFFFIIDVLFHLCTWYKSLRLFLPYPVSLLVSHCLIPDTNCQQFFTNLTHFTNWEHRYHFISRIIIEYTTRDSIASVHTLYHSQPLGRLLDTVWCAATFSRKHFDYVDTMKRRRHSTFRVGCL